jgi:hypothetical protein
MCALCAATVWPWSIICACKSKIIPSRLLSCRCSLCTTTTSHFSETTLCNGTGEGELYCRSSSVHGGVIKGTIKGLGEEGREVECTSCLQDLVLWIWKCEVRGELAPSTWLSDWWPLYFVCILFSPSVAMYAMPASKE